MDTRPQRTDFPQFPLADLHVHSRTSISPSVYWRLAHEQGIKLPKKDFREFESYLRLSMDHRMRLNDYFSSIYHTLLYQLSSGTLIQEKAFYEIFTGAYRNNIALLEMRTDILKVNHNGAHDLDHIILSMLRGMERALLEFPHMKAGIIFSLGREFPIEKNAITIEKAIKYRRRGIIGIDFAGPATKTFHYTDYTTLVRKAKRAGLGVTAHAGEVPEADDIYEALTTVSPSRIGHGIRAAYDTEIMRLIKRKRVVLEVCPLSNLMTRAVENVDELRWILRTFIENKIPFTINTDWPEMIEGGQLWRQYVFLKEHKLLSEEELRACNRLSFQASFIKKPGLDAYL